MGLIPTGGGKSYIVFRILQHFRPKTIIIHDNLLKKIYFIINCFAEEKILEMFKGNSPYISCKTTGEDHEFYHQETGSRLIVCNIRPRDVSSSLVREQLAQGQSMENLLPREVERYIIEQKIYHSSLKSKPI